MSVARRLFVLLPPADAGENHAALLHGAAALAETQACRLDVIAVQRPDDATSTVSLPKRYAWWRATISPMTRCDGATLSALGLEALSTLRAAEGPSLLLLPAGPLGEETAAHIAWRLGGLSLGRCTAVRLAGSDVQVQRAAYGGRVQLTLASEAAFCTATWRPRGTPASTAFIAPQVRDLVLQAVLPAAPQATPAAQADALPALEGARLVVCGGRGMQGVEGFAQLASITVQLGAALGGSLPTVDAGWVPVARQIGQSGKFVAPHTYFCVGVSGTPQHLAGVSADSRIVAVDKDPQAPIFARADVGVVAEWQVLLPLLAECLTGAPS